ncbi:3-dehydroquinate synthase [Desulfallas sp. Bu1-1]|uniref:3-dehydroquinate synthase n=1 Tax=Desulfallas sp. Bu1-1 TaxID=2787620 RepID=UPI0018A0B0D8|nr:3-dehydroquinate synthase [Desulfallas sp. Bu1-1]MBF7082145.1 3-dehydroquinate synthase [Desulfallas sp. Bu1-1]
MKEVGIDLGNRSYQIMIGNGLLERAGELIAGVSAGRKALLVTNPVVGNLYAGRVAASLEQAGFEVVRAEVPDGEQYKTLQSAEFLYDRAFDAGLDRQCPVVALGGGVIGDLAGFVAATYMRGVPFIQVPTTLLAQVDSSVGGKVAVNHPRGKNIIGAFYQPALVISDTGTLRTLDSREVRSGLAEVIKYGVIKDASFFTWLEDNVEKVLTLDSDAMAYVVVMSCRIKAAVVEEDETEQGSRAVLNFGHTVGHAVEALTGYTEYRHGEAVAIGMAAASRLAVNLKQMSYEEEFRINKLIEKAGLPLKVPGALRDSDMLEAMARDKKVYNDEITFILPRTIGKVSIERNIRREKILQAIAESKD